MKSQITALVVLALALITCVQAEFWEPASGKYQTLRDCRYIESGADDGDSFLVRQGGKEFLFRLYSVDTPETSMSYPQRVADQAAHFGITPAQAVKIGREAEAFTRRLLQAGAFTVQTCWQDAKGASQMKRYYVVITLGNGKDLAELLAGAGLARVYGFTPTTPGFSLPRLQGLERLAESRKLGAYGGGKAPPGAGATAVDASASRLPPTISAYARPASSPAAAAAATGGKVNVNTATEAQLLAVPGIGPHYAKRLIEGRPYKNVDDLVRVNGIGPKTLRKLAPYLSAGPR